jgi:hypothetical protein
MELPARESNINMKRSGRYIALMERLPSFRQLPSETIENSRHVDPIKIDQYE